MPAAPISSAGESFGGATGAVDNRTGNSPDPNSIAKASTQTQTVLNEHTSQLLKIQTLLAKLISKNNLNT